VSRSYCTPAAAAAWSPLPINATSPEKPPNSTPAISHCDATAPTAQCPTTALHVRSPLLPKQIIKLSGSMPQPLRPKEPRNIEQNPTSRRPRSHRGKEGCPLRRKSMNPQLRPHKSRNKPDTDIPTPMTVASQPQHSLELYNTTNHVCSYSWNLTQGSAPSDRQ